MPKTLPISDLQRDFKGVVDACQGSEEPVTLTRNGRPALVVMDPEVYEREKRMKDLVYEREMRLREQLNEGHAAYERGEWFSFDEVRAERTARGGRCA